MSYTLKVILISLAVWLGLCLLGGLLGGPGSYGLGFLLTGMVTGIIGAAGLFLTGIIILAAKLNSGKVRQQHDDVLDGQPTTGVDYRKRGLAFLAASGLILLIGTSVCFGAAGF